ncbi:death domain-containing protein CRADD [Triplophysa rosa]|uniref:Death domain-containing protein CRADD n=1 Tax=Triplophysa rosa TaxID=992332 RepID=A0A9W7WBA4_TRIRA|nr:death domain-containing protein CRADD [Triplophysa rosa]KAI7791763.1 death domain-containing protein CRADD [Triplophysa rosa]
MDPKHKKLLRSQRLQLADEILVDDAIVQYLYQEDILTLSHLEEIQCESSNRRKVFKLLDILPTRGSRAFHHFIKSLEKEFPWIKDSLLQLCDEKDSEHPPPFTGQCGLPDHILSTVPTTQHLNHLAACLGPEWKSVLLDLGLSSADLYRCCADHPLSIQSQVLAGLVMWTQRNGRKATVQRLLQSLQAADIPPSVLQQVFV